MSELPEVIYLQWIPEKTWYDDTVTWCEDQINDDDVKYIRADVAESADTGRLGLLREIEKKMANSHIRNGFCVVCEGRLVADDENEIELTILGYSVGHDPECELAKGLSDG